nr:MAG TPA: hypothetical protein [Caudoviricetes sp.]
MNPDEVIEITREAMREFRPLYDAVNEGQIRGRYLKSAILDAMAQLTVVIDEAEDWEGNVSSS